MIKTSFFELFKIGPGPSSSHTVGPMIAAKRFHEELSAFFEAKSPKGNYQIQVDLYGSLADTGVGHGSDRAILAGLFAFSPISVQVEDLNQYFSEKGQLYCLKFAQEEIKFRHSDIIFNYNINPYRHPNSMKFSLVDSGNSILESIFYSVGGGFVEEEGSIPEERISPVHQYKDMSSFMHLVESEQADMIEFLYENEMAISGLSKEQIQQRFDQIIKTMCESVERGLESEGVIPGGLDISRRAKDMYKKSKSLSKTTNFFSKLNAYALAVSEENACGHIVVTAPTNGAAGIIPAAIYYLSEDCNFPLKKLRHALMIAGLIAFIIKENASISGAELGCMAEVGSATAMAAALLTYSYDGSLKEIETAAEIALEHSLGMTCDPINGLVQVPCIERNATGIIKAYNAYLLASARQSDALISLDRVVEVMKQTGRDLSEKYRETSSGGLALYGWGNMPGS